MGQLLEIFGRGIQVDVADLIWNWLGQVAETLMVSDPKQSKLLYEVVEIYAAKKPSLLRQRINEYRSAYPNSHYTDLAETAIALDENRLTDAFALLKTVYSGCPRNITTLYALGHCCERLDREADAVAFYQDCLKFKNYLQFPHQRLAAIYFKNGQIQKTIGEYQLLASEYPDDLPTLLSLGYLYLAAGQFKNAADTFATAIIIQPDNFCPDTSPIDSLIDDDSLSDALDWLDNALNRYPDRPDLLLRRASVLAGLGQEEEALAQYDHLLDICPNFLEAGIKLGSYYLHLGKPENAAFEFTRAAIINDRLVDAYLGLATAQKLAGSVSESLSSISLAATVATNSPLLLTEAAHLQNIQADTDQFNPDSQSIAAILNAHNRLLQLNPENPMLHYRFGMLLMGVGQFDHATKLFRKTLELTPLFSAARNKLAICLFETGQKTLALENLSSPACLQADTLNLHYRLALLYCDKIKFASSLFNLEQWLRDTFLPADPVVNISVVLQNLGLIDPAVATWDNIGQPSEK